MDDDLTPPLAALSQLDQDRAELRRLVGLAREHTDAEVCEFVGACAGDWVEAAISLDVDEVRGLLCLAVAELAALGYGRPPRYLLTRAAYAALDAQPSRPWPFGGPSA